MLHTSRMQLRHGGRQWMQKQAHDPYVVEARRRGYVARSAFKLLHMDKKFGLFSRQTTRVVVDLGCSPGSWLQVIRERCGDQCALFGVDLLRVSATVPGAVCLQGDFTSLSVQNELCSRMAGVNAVGLVDVVTSDMCINRGSGATDDRQKQTELNMAAVAFAVDQLRIGGHFLCKALGSPTAYDELHQEAQRWFTQVATYKPFSSRRESDESFLVCLSKREKRLLRSSGEGLNGFGLDDWPGFARRPPSK